MSTYTAEHASALADIRAAGSAVTFAWTTTTYDASTGVDSAPVSHTMAGYAIRTKGNPMRYAALGLRLTEDPTLLFAPTTFGEVPPLGSSVSWNSLPYLVKAVDPVAPDGTAIIARVMVAR